MTDRLAPFMDFAPPMRAPSPLRRAITHAYRRSEAECLAPLLDAAALSSDAAARVRATASELVKTLRTHPKRTGVEGLLQEYSLSSEEGVALMCLAEALLRIPDTATRDALIRDKLSTGDWAAHIGTSPSLFVNAATWGLVVTGKLVDSFDDKRLSAAFIRLAARAGEPVIRKGVDLAMRLLGEQFVSGETIEQALRRARALEAKGFAYSYDMLGEAAATAADAARYLADYEKAIHAIGKAADRRGVYEGPGISIKLSALHPRYARAQIHRVMDELLPRVRQLALLAKSYDMGLNIDAEEADRLEISLDVLESLALDPELAGWNGLGFVVQAYGKRCPFVIEWIIDLARRAGRRMMVRLVKGAYWDSEIKRAQVDGLADFPVYTRKSHTDVAYIACARTLLAAQDAVFPQFATHNAQSLATIYEMAGPDFAMGDYEFQCLYGMGEALYEQVVGPAGLDRPCRIYAPVGTHETLLAYLVRRLLENGANSSFVNRIADPTVSIEDMVADPAELVSGQPHPGARNSRIALPQEIFPGRIHAAGMDLSDETTLSALTQTLKDSAALIWEAHPAMGEGRARMIVNPADHSDVVGKVFEASVEQALAAAKRARGSDWSRVPLHERAGILDRAADNLQVRMPILLGLIIREAGKSLPNAVAEVREAVDFLRYYAMQARETVTAVQPPLGPVTCISPWNFPLAIFMGQIAAALVTGNPVLAKPAEETPLIAAEAVRLLHEAGVPEDALQLLPGDGEIGAALVAAPETAGVMFTGSTQVARLIQRTLAPRLSLQGQPIPLIAETGGQNAMIVDSSALMEQVTFDVIASAFDSAGQRCSALRILCLQEDIADHALTMLKGALKELHLGQPDALRVDIGPVITAEAKISIEAHIAAMRAQGAHVVQQSLPPQAAKGTFVPPTIIEIDDIAELKREVFGPVLHVIRYGRDNLDAMIDAINATGYGLTFGLHTRLDTMIEHVTARVKAGNLYVNRNIIGAVVGSQPFGGRGLSGTGPKAGGPLYLGRLLRAMPVVTLPGRAEAHPFGMRYLDWLEQRGDQAGMAMAQRAVNETLLGYGGELPGPVGERNLYTLHPRGEVLAIAQSPSGLLCQLASALAAGNGVSVLWLGEGMPEWPPDLDDTIRLITALPASHSFGAVMIEPGVPPGEWLPRIAAMEGPIPLIQQGNEEGHYRPDWLVEEQSIAINTAAAGGNASLMAMA